MARLRFPGRPGFRFGRIGLRYTRGSPQNVADYATKLITNIHKGLRCFHEIFGESDEDEFSGFTAEEVNLASLEVKKTERLLLQLLKPITKEKLSTNKSELHVKTRKLSQKEAKNLYDVVIKDGGAKPIEGGLHSRVLECEKKIQENESEEGKEKTLKKDVKRPGFKGFKIQLFGKGCFQPKSKSHDVRSRNLSKKVEKTSTTNENIHASGEESDDDIRYSLSPESNVKTVDGNVENTEICSQEENHSKSKSPKEQADTRENETKEVEKKAKSSPVSEKGDSVKDAVSEQKQIQTQSVKRKIRSQQKQFMLPTVSRSSRKIKPNKRFIESNFSGGFSGICSKSVTEKKTDVTKVSSHLPLDGTVPQSQTKGDCKPTVIYVSDDENQQVVHTKPKNKSKLCFTSTKVNRRHIIKSKGSKGSKKDEKVGVLDLPPVVQVKRERKPSNKLLEKWTDERTSKASEKDSLNHSGSSILQKAKLHLDKTAINKSKDEFVKSLEEKMKSPEEVKAKATEKQIKSPEEVKAKATEEQMKCPEEVKTNSTDEDQAEDSNDAPTIAMEEPPDQGCDDATLSETTGIFSGTADTPVQSRAKSPFPSASPHDQSVDSSKPEKDAVDDIGNSTSKSKPVSREQLFPTKCKTCQQRISVPKMNEFHSLAVCKTCYEFYAESVKLTWQTKKNYECLEVFNHTRFLPEHKKTRCPITVRANYWMNKSLTNEEKIARMCKACRFERICRRMPRPSLFYDLVIKGNRSVSEVVDTLIADAQEVIKLEDEKKSKQSDSKLDVNLNDSVTDGFVTDNQSPVKSTELARSDEETPIEIEDTTSTNVTTPSKTQEVAEESDNGDKEKLPLPSPTAKPPDKNEIVENLTEDQKKTPLKSTQLPVKSGSLSSPRFKSPIAKLVMAQKMSMNKKWPRGTAGSEPSSASKKKDRKGSTENTEDEQPRTRGPRIKHVCRRASVALGKPVATFSDISLSALPSKDKVKAIQKAEDSDAVSVDEEVAASAGSKARSSDIHSPSNKRRGQRCMKCEGCLRKACGTCVNCRSRSSSVKKMACLKRKCLLSSETKKQSKAEESKPRRSSTDTSSKAIYAKKTGGSPREMFRCKNCFGCLASDCGDCRYCRDMPKFGGPGRLSRSCVARTCERYPVLAPTSGDEEEEEPVAEVVDAARRALSFSADTGADRRPQRRSKRVRKRKRVSSTDEEESLPPSPCRNRKRQREDPSEFGDSDSGSELVDVEGDESDISARQRARSSKARGDKRSTHWYDDKDEIRSLLREERKALGSKSTGQPPRKKRPPAGGADDAIASEEPVKGGRMRTKLPILPSLAQLSTGTAKPEFQVKKKQAAHVREKRSSNAEDHLILIDFKEDYDIDRAFKEGVALLSTTPFCVRAVCLLCGCQGQQQLLYCAICCEPFHWFCLEDAERPLRTQVLDDWCCPRCQFCHVCAKQNDLLKCTKCGDTYHPGCLGPNYPTKPTEENVWLCTRCVKCRSCSRTTPGDKPTDKWTHNFALCQPCGQLVDKGNYCPVCHKCYSDDDWEIKMIQCEACQNWVHAKCEDMTDEMYEIFSLLPEETPFKCRVCAPGETHHLDLIRSEMRAGFTVILQNLLKSKEIGALMPASVDQESQTPGVDFPKRPPSRAILPPIEDDLAQLAAASANQNTTPETSKPVPTDKLELNESLVDIETLSPSGNASEGTGLSDNLAKVVTLSEPSLSTGSESCFKAPGERDTSHPPPRQLLRLSEDSRSTRATPSPVSMVSMESTDSIPTDTSSDESHKPEAVEPKVINAATLKTSDEPTTKPDSSDTPQCEPPRRSLRSGARQKNEAKPVESAPQQDAIDEEDEDEENEDGRKVTNTQRLEKLMKDVKRAAELMKTTSTSSQLVSVGGGGEHPRTLHAVYSKLGEGVYCSVEEFCGDIVRILRFSMQLASKVGCPNPTNNCRTIFIHKMEECFPWYNVNTSTLWQYDRSLPEGMLPEAVLPPYEDHTYAQWLERTELHTCSLSPQMSPFKRVPPTPYKHGPDSPRRGTPGGGNPRMRSRVWGEDGGGSPTVFSTDIRVDDVRKCGFCGEFGDKPDHEVGRLLHTGLGEWVHVNCALWSAEVFEEVDGTLQNVFSALSRGRQLLCNVCEKKGATVGCCARVCNANFHMICALQAGCVFQEDKKVYCREHVDYAVSIIEDGKLGVLRRSCVDLNNNRYRKELRTGMSPDSIHLLVGSMCLEFLGVLKYPLSDTPSVLLPVGYCVSRVYWSTKDPRRRCMYSCRIVEIVPPELSTLFPARDLTVAHDKCHPSFDINLHLKYTSLKRRPSDDTASIARRHSSTISSVYTDDFGLSDITMYSTPGSQNASVLTSPGSSALRTSITDRPSRATMVRYSPQQTETQQIVPRLVTALQNSSAVVQRRESTRTTVEDGLLQMVERLNKAASKSKRTTSREGSVDRMSVGSGSTTSAPSPRSPDCRSPLPAIIQGYNDSSSNPKHNLPTGDSNKQGSSQKMVSVLERTQSVKSEDGRSYNIRYTRQAMPPTRPVDQASGNTGRQTVVGSRPITTHSVTVNRGSVSQAMTFSQGMQRGVSQAYNVPLASGTISKINKTGAQQPLNYRSSGSSLPLVSSGDIDLAVTTPSLVTLTANETSAVLNDVTTADTSFTDETELQFNAAETDELIKCLVTDEQAKPEGVGSRRMHGVGFQDSFSKFVSDLNPANEFSGVARSSGQTQQRTFITTVRAPPSRSDDSGEYELLDPGQLSSIVSITPVSRANKYSVSQLDGVFDQVDPSIVQLDGTSDDKPTPSSSGAVGQTIREKIMQKIRAESLARSATNEQGPKKCENCKRVYRTVQSYNVHVKSCNFVVSSDEEEESDNDSATGMDDESIGVQHELDSFVPFPSSSRGTDNASALAYFDESDRKTVCVKFAVPVEHIKLPERWHGSKSEDDPDWSTDKDRDLTRRGTPRRQTRRTPTAPSDDIPLMDMSPTREPEPQILYQGVPLVRTPFKRRRGRPKTHKPVLVVPPQPRSAGLAVENEDDDVSIIEDPEAHDAELEAAVALSLEDASTTTVPSVADARVTPESEALTSSTNPLSVTKPNWNEDSRAKKTFDLRTALPISFSQQSSMVAMAAVSTGNAVPSTALLQKSKPYAGMGECKAPLSVFESVSKPGIGMDCSMIGSETTAQNKAVAASCSVAPVSRQTAQSAGSPFARPSGQSIMMAPPTEDSPERTEPSANSVQVPQSPTVHHRPPTALVPSSATVHHRPVSASNIPPVVAQVPVSSSVKSPALAQSEETSRRISIEALENRFGQKIKVVTVSKGELMHLKKTMARQRTTSSPITASTGHTQQGTAGGKGLSVQSRGPSPIVIDSDSSNTTSPVTKEAPFQFTQSVTNSQTVASIATHSRMSLSTNAYPAQQQHTKPTIILTNNPSSPAYAPAASASLAQMSPAEKLQMSPRAVLQSPTKRSPPGPPRDSEGKLQAQQRRIMSKGSPETPTILRSARPRKTSQTLDGLISSIVNQPSAQKQQLPEHVTITMSPRQRPSQPQHSIQQQYVNLPNTHTILVSQAHMLSPQAASQQAFTVSNQPVASPLAAHSPQVLVHSAPSSQTYQASPQMPMHHTATPPQHTQLYLNRQPVQALVPALSVQQSRAAILGHVQAPVYSINSASILSSAMTSQGYLAVPQPVVSPSIGSGVATYTLQTSAGEFQVLSSGPPVPQQATALYAPSPPVHTQKPIPQEQNYQGRVQSSGSYSFQTSQGPVQAQAASHQDSITHSERNTLSEHVVLRDPNNVKNDSRKRPLTRNDSDLEIAAKRQRLLQDQRRLASLTVSQVNRLTVTTMPHDIFMAMHKLSVRPNVPSRFLVALRNKMDEWKAMHTSGPQSFTSETYWEKQDRLLAAGDKLLGPVKKMKPSKEPLRENIRHDTTSTAHTLIHATGRNLHLPEPSVEEEVKDVPLYSIFGQRRGAGEMPVKRKDRPHLRFEIESDDGFKVQADSWDDAWQAVVDKVQDARANARMKQLSFTGVNGLSMFGLSHSAVVYLVEQLFGAHACKNYAFKYHHYERSEYDEEPEENPTGCARSEPFTTRKPYEMFSFLLSKYRKKPTPATANSKDSDIAIKSQRRVTSLELPLAMRFRALKTHAKEAVGVYRSAIHGRGLFCKRDIDAGEMIIEYTGEVIRSWLTDKREKHYESMGIGCYMFRIDENCVIDATLRGSAARFINHSCEPNCYSKIVNVESTKHIVIFAMRQIKKGEELTYDYKFPIEDVKIPCTCNFKKCRKYLN